MTKICTYLISGPHHHAGQRVFGSPTGERRAPMSCRNMPIRGGTFSGSGIEGRFYGPNHEEVAGVFERNRLVGAFGAKC